ncbi:hypothetical protein DICPUDRAFT_156657 [Dictyostelium purpureum]|uniref:BAR domain-containing protein n=1 Tax=Dictyostelium purpureum TaxID=5786 RepID=F0ZX30_DICPU|nr:uncharacterized protein DICPUDRAFT_156657 [Dictyostelium purpureum]EGC31501.1 hypothetical protein DICPUDRAFT_156657 [Dictyostelium purpureum]|eukprot:XP_003291976.1 hypothetical protein DICPUDRAFT_156657 [Dictyostelium purpureum]
MTSLEKERRKSISYDSKYGNSKGVKSISSDDYQKPNGASTSNSNFFNKKKHQRFTSVAPAKSNSLNNSSSSNSTYSSSSSSNSSTYTNKSNSSYSSNNNKENNASGNMPPLYSTTHTTATSRTNAPIANPSSPNDATSPNKSRMKRLSLTVSITSQMYLEKMGKASSSNIDSEDIKKMKNSLSEIKKDCKLVMTKGKQSVLTVEKQSNKFGETILGVGNGFLKGTNEGEALCALGEQIAEFDESIKEGTMGCMGSFIEPLNKFYDEDIKKARDLKKKQNLARIKFEHAELTYNDIKKKNDLYSNKTMGAKNEMEESKKIYTETTKDFYKKMVENEKNFKLELRKQIRDYVQMQVEFYREMLENWEEFAEEIDEIIPADDAEIAQREEEMRKRIEAGEDDDSDGENDDDLLADL